MYVPPNTAYLSIASKLLLSIVEADLGLLGLE